MALTKIKTGGITDLAVTTAKINNNAVTDAKVADAITVTASTISGSTLASGVTASSLTSVGTLTSLTTSGVIKTTGTGGRTIILESTDNAQSLNIDFWSNAGAVQGRINYAEGAGAFNFQPNQPGGATALSLDWSNNATFAGTITSGTHLIDGVSNYTGLEVKGSGGSRPQIKWTNANNGNIGSIYGTEGNSLIINTGTSLSTCLQLGSDQSATFESTVQAKGLIYAGNDDTDEERFRVFNASTGSLRMYAGTQAANYNADDNNFVLEVGTRGGDPHFKSIHAKGNCLFASVTGNVEIGGGSKTSAALRVGGANDSGGRLYFQYNGDSSYIDAWGGHGGTERLRDLKIMGRKLEFNTGDTPVKKVEIQSGGDMVTRRIFPQSHNTYSLGASGDFKWTTLFATNGTINTSDETLKENIIDCDEGAEFIKSLRPVSFNWKDIERNGTLDKEQKHYGFIAQEIIKTPLKDSVTGEEGSYGMNYMNFIAPIVKALQEALERIETLENA